MEELDGKTRALLETLYFEVKAYVESEYNAEGVINPNKKNSTKIIFKDRKNAITLVKNAIQDFAKENDLDTNIVKDYILKLIEKDINSDSIYKEEYYEVEKIVSVVDEEER